MFLYNKKFRYFSKDCKTSCSSCNSKCTVNDFLATDVGVMNVILEPSVTVLMDTQTNRTCDGLRRDHVEIFQSSWMTSNILGTVTQPQCR